LGIGAGAGVEAIRPVRGLGVGKVLCSL